MSELSGKKNLLSLDRSWKILLFWCVHKVFYAAFVTISSFSPLLKSSCSNTGNGDFELVFSFIFEKLFLLYVIGRLWFYYRPFGLLYLSGAHLLPKFRFKSVNIFFQKLGFTQIWFKKLPLELNEASFKSIFECNWTILKWTKDPYYQVWLLRVGTVVIT